MEDSEPTLSTEPSSRAMRARAFTWVLTRSCQFTTDFGEAVMDFGPRAMLTAGIRRETSPARWPAPCGAAKVSAGIASRNESETARPRAWGDFVFIEDSPEWNICIYRSYWRAAGLSIVFPKPFAYSLYACADKSAASPSRSRKTTR